MHFGTGPLNITQIEQDPYILQDYLDEIETCHRCSKSVFFMVSKRTNERMNEHIHYAVQSVNPIKLRHVIALIRIV